MTALLAAAGVDVVGRDSVYACVGEAVAALHKDDITHQKNVLCGVGDFAMPPDTPPPLKRSLPSWAGGQIAADAAARAARVA